MSNAGGVSSARSSLCSRDMRNFVSERWKLRAIVLSRDVMCQVSACVTSRQAVPA